MRSGAADRHRARWTFGAADQAQPQAVGCQCGSDLRREPLSLAWFIEDMKAAAIEDELEGASGWSRGEKVPCREAAAESPSRQFSVGSFDGERRDIDSEYVETAFGQPNGIRTGTRADLKRPCWRDAARSDEPDEQRFWLSGVPGQLS